VRVGPAFRAMMLLVGGGLAFSAEAGEQQQSFRTVWQVEAATGPETELSIAPGALVFKQRLLPFGLAVLDEEYRASKLDENLSIGTELIRTVGSAFPVYCALRAKNPNFLAALSPLPNKKMRCFVDDNQDGRFDREMIGYSNTPELPHPIGFLPKSMVPTVSLRYSTRDATKFSSGFVVGVKYTGQAKIGTLRRFQTVYGTEDRWGYFSSDNIFTKRDSDLPKTLAVLGATFVVLGGDGRNVRIRVDRMMPPQPFGVVARTIYY
jgi:hypothetical protein